MGLPETRAIALKFLTNECRLSAKVIAQSLSNSSFSFWGATNIENTFVTIVDDIHSQRRRFTYTLPFCWESIELGA